MDAQQIFATIGEPTRYRIVTLLADGPRTVGEVAAALGALQPQTTKHLQALESVGVVRVQRLGRRRLASLNRQALRHLATWFDRMGTETEDDRTLVAYAMSVADAQKHSGTGAALTADIKLERRIHAPVAAVWAAWTDARVAQRWWAPRHFEVVQCAIQPTTGAAVQLVLREADGSMYASAGSVQEVETEKRLRFELSPLDDQGRALFRVEIDVELEGSSETTVHLAIRVSEADQAAAPMLAGLEPGWSQQLDRLDALLATG